MVHSLDLVPECSLRWPEELVLWDLAGCSLRWPEELVLWDLAGCSLR